MRFTLLIKNVLYVHQITFVILNLTNWSDALLTQYQYYICVSFLLFDRKHLEKVLKKSWSTITLGWFVFALLLASRLLLLGKQTMGWGEAKTASAASTCTLALTNSSCLEQTQRGWNIDLISSVPAMYSRFFDNK